MRCLLVKIFFTQAANEALGLEQMRENFNHLNGREVSSLEDLIAILLRNRIKLAHHLSDSESDHYVIRSNRLQKRDTENINL